MYSTVPAASAGTGPTTASATPATVGITSLEPLKANMLSANALTSVRFGTVVGITAARMGSHIAHDAPIDSTYPKRTGIATMSSASSPANTAVTNAWYEDTTTISLRRSHASANTPPTGLTTRNGRASMPISRAVISGDPVRL